MAEYIEKAAVLEILKRHPSGAWKFTPVYSEEIKTAMLEIEELPAADVAPVWLEKLAAYEATGLEPAEVLPKEFAGEIMQSMILLKEYQEIGSIEELKGIKQDIEIDGFMKSTARRYGVDVDRLRELAQAEREGRCVVLPPPTDFELTVARWMEQLNE